MSAERGGDGLAHTRFVQARAFERLADRVEPHRRRRDRADAEREPPARAVLVERDLRRRRREREVALARADLVEANADARLAPDRKADRGKTAGRRQRRHHRADEEFGRPAISRRSRFPRDSDSVAPSVTATSAISAAGSALASEPPMVPRARVGAWPMNGMTLASSGTSARDDGIALEHALPGGGADHDRVALLCARRQARQCGRCRSAASGARAAWPSAAPASARRR